MGAAVSAARVDSPARAPALELRAPRRTSRDSEPHPLAEAKLLAPRIRDGLIDRARIHDRFDAGERGSALTLVAAPPGYGKTTAVRSWCASRKGGLAWVTLDRGDNDPVRFWQYIATAVDRVRSGLGQPALRRLATNRARSRMP